MSLGGATGYMRPEDYLVSNGGPSASYLPYAQSGPYQDIMSRMGNQGYVSYNQIAPASSSAMGGYDPNLYQRATAPQPGFISSGIDYTDPFSASLGQTYGPAWSNVGGSSKGGGPDPTGGGPNPWSSFTDAQKAKWFSENQDSPITSFQKLVEGVWSYTPMGMLQNAFDPNIMAKQALITQGVDPGAALEGTNVGTISQPNPITGYSFGPEGQAGTTYEGKRGFVDDSTRGGGGGYAAGSYSGAPAAGSDVGRSAPGSAHAGLAKGGQVSMQHLQGPNPAGPDEGYGALKSGEFVINDKAVSKYGIEIMNAINSGKISKGKLRGLLEM